jgi:DNA-directed RNA polymerase specialized sigma24 family protein
MQSDKARKRHDAVAQVAAGIPYRDIATALGVSVDFVYGAAYDARKAGTLTVPPRVGGRKKQVGRRERIVAQIAGDVPYADICREFGICLSTLYSEATAARKAGLLTGPKKRTKTLEETQSRAAQLAMEREAAEMAALTEQANRATQIASDVQKLAMVRALAGVPDRTRQIADAVHLSGWEPGRLARKLGVPLSEIAGHLAAERSARRSGAEQLMRDKENAAMACG